MEHVNMEPGLRVIGGMTPYPSPRVREVMAKYAHVNAGDPKSYPEVALALEELVDRLSRLMFPGGGVGGGVFTSGASESNLLALLALRERGSRKVVAFDTAHYSVRKAARILGMEFLELPSQEGFLPRLDLLESRLREGDVLVLTMGTTETGFVDPVSLAARLAGERGALIHVDAAYAGPLIRYWAPWKSPSVLGESVVSLAVDLHKIPEAPIGSGLLLAGEPGFLDSIRWPAPYLPTGYQAGVLGTRPGGNLMASLVALDEMEARGPERLARELLEAARELARELGDCCGYRVRHPVETPVVCLEHPRLDALLGYLSRRGVSAYTCMRGSGVRIALLPHVLPQLVELKTLLADPFRE